MEKRVLFFSERDLSIGHFLELSEKRITEISEGSKLTTINDIIELWHIKKIIGTGCRLNDWDNLKYEQMLSAVNGYNKVIGEYFNNLNPQIIEDEFEKLERHYRKTIWEIIDTFGLYKLIESKMLSNIISKNINYFRYVLSCKGIVEKFKIEIRKELMSKAVYAQLIIDKYLARSSHYSDTLLFLPSNLTIQDKEQIIINYLDSDNPNLNYVRLITQAKDDKKNFVLSPKTKLRAKRLADKLNDELLKSPNSAVVKTQIIVSYKDNEDSKIKTSYIEGEKLIFSYSIPYIRKCNNIARIANVSNLFECLNQHAMINLINKHSECGELCEFLNFDKARNAYNVSYLFECKNNIACLQISSYDKILHILNSSLEKEIKTFFENRIKKEYLYPGLNINLPSDNESWLNKCRIICPELDSIVKQYDTYIEEGEIDIDLIRLSKPMKLEDCRSLLSNKYYEISEENDEINGVLNLLFSSQSLLSCVYPFEYKNYNSLYDLLINETSILYSNYYQHQKCQLDFLIKNNVISVDNRGYIVFSNEDKINILKQIWEYGACSYWHYNDKCRAILDELHNKGWLEINDHLLTKAEQDYYSYFLDNKRFTNGMSYRNMYVHGSNPPVDSENEHANAYYQLLLLFTMLIIKIEDDMWLASNAMNINKDLLKKYL